MTHYQYTPFIIPLVVTALFGVAMLVVAWRNRAEPVALWFAATVAALLVWTTGYVFELMAVGLHAKIMWADIEYAATIALPLFWLQVVVVYTRRRGLSRTVWVALSAAGGVLYVGIVVNPARLFRGDPTVVTHGALNALHPDYGPLWSFGWVPFEYGVLLVAALLLVRAMTHAHSIHVRQSLALMAASILPLAGGTAYALRLSPWPDYNPAMAVLSVSGLLMAYALFSCRLFDLAPLARDAVIEHLADGVMVLDVQGRLRDFNPAAALSFPELGRDSIGRPIAELFAARPDVGAVLQEAARGSLQEGPGERRSGRSWDVESVAASGDGPPVHNPHVLNLRATTVASGAGTVLGLAVVVCDVTERVALLDDALRLATTDGLTGVLTRRRFTELAELEVTRAAARAAPLTVLVLDLDRLRVVNDTHGHVAGDRLLSAVAAGWKATLRDGDLMGRLGGDEFCVLLPATDSDEARPIAERLRSSTPQCSPWDQGVPWRCTVSIGMATVQHSRLDDRFGELLDAADRALYVAKEGGRDRVIVASTHGEREPFAGAAIT